MKHSLILEAKELVVKSPSIKEILARARMKNKPFEVFYGETYDGSGNTIDSMKYYFFVANMAEALREEGLQVNPQILIADTAACRNVAPELERKYMMFGQSRAEFVEKINKVYGTGLKVVMMSDYIHSTEFQKKREEIMKLCKSNPELMAKVEKTVPESKLEIEKGKGFMYSFDEIATIIDLDLKVGPPREDLYDEVARDIASKQNKPGLMSLFLTPAFPLGKNWAYFFANDGIEDHGITAYKAGSKRLQDFRILLGRTTPEHAKELIDASFISTNPELPNPVLDIGIICEMARQRLEGDDYPIALAQEFYSGKISPEELKKKIYKSLEKNIIGLLK